MREYDAVIEWVVNCFCITVSCLCASFGLYRLSDTHIYIAAVCGIAHVQPRVCFVLFEIHGIATRRLANVQRGIIVVSFFFFFQINIFHVRLSDSRGAHATLQHSIVHLSSVFVFLLLVFASVFFICVWDILIYRERERTVIPTSRCESVDEKKKKKKKNCS